MDVTMGRRDHHIQGACLDFGTSSVTNHLHNPLWYRCCQPCFTEEAAKAQRGLESCPKSHNSGRGKVQTRIFLTPESTSFP